VICVNNDIWLLTPLHYYTRPLCWSQYSNHSCISISWQIQSVVTSCSWFIF
jgi:hypothetical protein